MATETTELRRPQKKKTKSIHPSLIKAKEALESKTSNLSTPLSQVKPEPSEITLSVSAVYKKNGYKVVENVMDYYQWRKIPVSQEWLNGLARKMIEFAYFNEDSYHWMYFCKENGISVQAFYEYASRYPIIAQAKEDAREIIAARRDVTAFKASPASVMLGTQTYHSKSFAYHKKEAATWSNKDLEKTGTFNLNFYDQKDPEEENNE